MSLRALRVALSGALLGSALAVSGCGDDEKKDPPKNEAPAGLITAPAADAAIEAGESVVFEGSCSDPEGDALTHLWDFDGAHDDSTAVKPGAIVFAEVGTFTVSYTCSDAEGLADPTPATRTVTVTAPAPNVAPSATITAPAADVAIDTGASVTFTGTCSDPEGTTVSHAWSFGTGGPAGVTTQNPGAIVFPSAGTFVVSYVCTDAEGLADATPATRTVTVSDPLPPNEPPVASIVAPADDPEIEVGDSVTFEGACDDPEDGEVTHAWDFGTLGTSTEAAPDAIVFVTVGIYDVSYTCTDDGGLTAEPVTRKIVVVAKEPDPTHAISGTITFDKVLSDETGLDYAEAIVRPVRDVEVQVIDADDPENVVATVVTDAEGKYEASWEQDGPDRIIVYALTRTAEPVITVGDNTAEGAIYGLGSSVVDLHDTNVVDLHAAHGWNGTAYESRSAAPFAVLDAAYEAASKFLDVRPDIAFPDLTLYWSVDNSPTEALPDETKEAAYAAGRIGTSHWNGEALYILGLEDVDTDEFDDHTIVHEWGHYFEAKLGRSDGPGGTHGAGDLKDPRLAFGEGWGNAVGAMVWWPNTTYSDATGPAQSEAFRFDVEANVDNDANPGWFSEASVQALLLDLFDDSGADEDFDQVALGLGPIYDVMVGAQKETFAFTTIFSFVAALKDAEPDASEAIDTLTAYNGVLGAPVADAFGTGETNDGGHASNLPVYASLDDGPVTTALVGDPLFNTLGQIRYFRFVGDGAEHTVSLETSDEMDPDVYVYRQGVLVTSMATFSGNEVTEAFVAEEGIDYIVQVSGEAVTLDCTITVTLN